MFGTDLKLDTKTFSIVKSSAVLEEILKLENLYGKEKFKMIKSSYDDFIIKDFDQYSEELSVCISIMQKLTEEE